MKEFKTEMEAMKNTGSEYIRKKEKVSLVNEFTKRD